MKTCLVLRHVGFEDLGLFAAAIRQRDYAIRYIDTPVEPLNAASAIDADLLIVLGGPIGADQTDLFPWLRDELRALSLRLAERRPTLGICLGAQLMAAALGAEILSGPAPEIGWAPLELSAKGRASPLAIFDGLPVLHWHNDRFALPTGADSLASTPLCPHQAFALDSHALALQFHAEVDPSRFEHWLVANANELAAVGLMPDTLRRDTDAHAAAIRRAAPAMIDSWLAGLT